MRGLAENLLPGKEEKRRNPGDVHSFRTAIRAKNFASGCVLPPIGIASKKAEIPPRPAPAAQAVNEERGAADRNRNESSSRPRPLLPVFYKTRASHRQRTPRACTIRNGRDARSVVNAFS